MRARAEPDGDALDRTKASLPESEPLEAWAIKEVCMGLVKNIQRTHFIWSITGEFLHFAAISGLICSVDQMLKSAIDTEPEENFPRDLPGSHGLVKIMRAHNPGFSKGHLKEYPEFVKLSSMAAVGFLAGGLQYLTGFFPKRYRIRKLGMSIVIGGALSNVLDRALHGAVTDYLNIRIGGLKKIIVNIGDIAICLGGALYALAALFGKDE